MSLPTPIHVHITSKNTDVRKFQALKRYGTQITLDMTLKIRSHAKGHSRYELEILSECVKLFKVRYTKFRDDRPIRSRVILGKPEGVASTPSPRSVPARVNNLIPSYYVPIRFQR